MGLKARFLQLLAVLVLMGGAFAAGSWWSQRPHVLRPIATAGQPTLGQQDAPVQVVVFADFKCPFCARYERDVFPKLRAHYIDSGKVAYSFVNLAFLGPDSDTAAQAGECIAHQEARLFWPFADAVYQHQGNEATLWATPEALASMAAKVPEVDGLAFQTSQRPAGP